MPYAARTFLARLLRRDKPIRIAQGLQRYYPYPKAPNKNSGLSIVKSFGTKKTPGTSRFHYVPGAYVLSVDSYVIIKLIYFGFFVGALLLDGGLYTISLSGTSQ